MSIFRQGSLAYRKFDYVQEAVPPAQNVLYRTWLRLPDCTAFCWMGVTPRWLELGHPSHLDVSGIAGSSAGSPQARFHEIVTNTGGQNWRPAMHVLFVGMSVNASNVPTSNYAVEVRSITSVLQTLGFGAGFNAKRFFEIEITPGERISLRQRELFASPTGVPPENWTAAIHYREFVPTS